MKSLSTNDREKLEIMRDFKDLGGLMVSITIF